ncbi:Na(+)/H(+) antiporter NhaA [Candidatus Nitrotoga sp. HW29]|uniref:Na+/H+ antiporter NhaA n=1 Tax=Candidatus Nitrotoga sp. HW29 TaxID=2886963 RepID=UPI001EF1D846|nr:Na+/H+ antiporter NhaA [Candidatus Nitrotoga sp. HW29]CAH1904112.1 Na(+)/H(+) antiporter NhaA [Candidatus Nitrotoga sp. HW29]
MSNTYISKLDPPVHSQSDHTLGETKAAITLVEYGSYNCSYCQAAHDVVANLRDRFDGRMRYVFRHRPISGNTKARQAAELAEYAHETTNRYWETHDALMKLGPSLEHIDFETLAIQLDLPPRDASTQEAWSRAQAKVEADIASSKRSGAPVSPTFFINSRCYEGPWDENTLAEAILGSLGHRMQTMALGFARWAPSTGLLLLAMTLLAVVMVNSPIGPMFEALWNMPTGLIAGDMAFQLPLREWINDCLLTIFFLVVGLEIKRELTVGRLAARRAAALPLAAALGGMTVPAIIYLLLVPAGPLTHGWAIPTTTDTAFAVALIAFLGRRVPVELRVFLTAAVVVDDLVAIVLVTVFYSGHIDPFNAAAAVIVTGLLVLLNRGGVYRALPYALLGVVLWLFLHAAGLHATLAGVIVAILTPTRPPANLAALMAQAESVIHAELRSAEERVMRHGPSESSMRALDVIHDRIESPADKLLRAVEPWSSYLVLPLFALANAGLVLSMEAVNGREFLILAITLGLVVGKPLGMITAAAIAVRMGWAVKPDAYSWRQMIGAATLAGIGFTMSLYIAEKAFLHAPDFAAGKIGVFLASILAGALGFLLLWQQGKRKI